MKLWLQWFSTNINLLIEFITQFQAQYASGGGGGQAQYGGETDDNIAMLEKAVPGTPGEDYPIYAEVFMN